MADKESAARPQGFTDPVCRMKVTAENAAAKLEYPGKTYCFCNAGCKQAFVEAPERFAE